MDSISELFGRVWLAKAIWWLNNRSHTSFKVAKLAITQPDIAGVGDALIRNAPGQTYRFVK